MKKSALSVASLVIAVTLTVAPALHAEQTGCNPHPQVATMSTWSMIVLTALSMLGGV